MAIYVEPLAWRIEKITNISFGVRTVYSKRGVEREKERGVQREIELCGEIVVKRERDSGAEREI